jgi:hypothetical protein
MHGHNSGQANFKSQSHRAEECRFVNCVGKVPTIEGHFTISLLCNVLCMKRGGRVLTTLWTVSRPCVKTDTWKRNIDNKHQAVIGTWKHVSRMKRWFSLPIPVNASGVINRLRDAQVATVRQIVVKRRSSGHFCMNGAVECRACLAKPALLTWKETIPSIDRLMSRRSASHRNRRNCGDFTILRPTYWHGDINRNVNGRTNSSWKVGIRFLNKHNLRDTLRHPFHEKDCRQCGSIKHL